MLGGEHSSHKARWQGGFISYVALLISFFLIGLLSIYFFNQGNLAKRVGERAVSDGMTALANLHAAMVMDKEFRRLDEELNGGGYATLNDALKWLRRNPGSGRTFDCSENGLGVFPIYEGADYSRVSGTCAQYLAPLGAKLFPAQGTPAQEEVLSGPNHLFSMKRVRVRYAVVAFQKLGSGISPVGIHRDSFYLYSLESQFPPSYAFQKSALLSGLEPGFIWDAPVYFQGESYNAWDKIDEDPSSFPSYFEYGLFTNIRPTPIGTFFLGGKGGVVKAFSRKSNAWRDNYLQLPSLANTRINSSLGTLTIRLNAPDSAHQEIYVNGTPIPLSKGKNVLDFPLAFELQIESGDASDLTLYALAPLSGTHVVIRTPATIRITTPIEARDPRCSKPPEVRFDKDIGEYNLLRHCDGPLPDQSVAFISTKGNVEIGYLAEEIVLNGVHILAPKGAFRLSPLARPLSGRAPTKVAMRMVGGAIAKTFGPWKPSGDPTPWTFSFTAGEYRSNSYLDFLPKASRNITFFGFSP